MAPNNLEDVALRHQLADAARVYNWDKVFDILRNRPELVNSVRPEGRARFTPLHQAAHGRASIAVMHHLLDLGASRTAVTIDGKTPLDIAREKNLDTERLTLLVPVVLTQLQCQFHAVIMSRAEDLIAQHHVDLPCLVELFGSGDLVLEGPEKYIAIPGMYGGFTYCLVSHACDPDVPPGEIHLITSSWCRVAGGSGMTHRVTPCGYTLLDSGFV